jgi:hypothetical protein
MKRRNKRLAGVLAAAGLAISAAMIGSAGTARADVVPPPAPTWSEIYNPFLHLQNITLCADDPSGSTNDGQWLHLWRCHGYASNGTMQRWYFFQSYVQDGSGNYVPLTEDGYPVYQVYNLAAGKCLNREDGYWGNPVTLRSCDRVGDGRWELRPTPLSSTAFELEGWPADDPQFGGVCVSASNFTDNNDTGLVKEPCSYYDTSQLWSLG